MEVESTNSAQSPPPAVPTVATSTVGCPAPADVDASRIRSDFLEFAIANSAPSPPPKRWPCLNRREEIRSLSTTLFDFRRLLRQKFDEKQLAAVGIDVRDDHSYSRCAIFDDKHLDFVVELDETSRPRGLYNANGLVFLERWPAVERAMAVTGGDTAGTLEPLLTTETISDLHVLRALGFQAALLRGLETMGIAQFARMFDRTADDSPWRYHIIIVDWDVTEVSVGTRRLAEWNLTRLSRLQYLYQRNPAERFVQWQPSGKQIGEIRDYQSFADSEKIRSIFDSQLSRLKQDRAWKVRKRSKPLTCTQARRALKRCVAQYAGKPQVRDVKAALDQYREAYLREVVTPLDDYADRAASPTDRLVFLHLMDMHAASFELEPLVKAAQQIIVAEHPGPNWEHDRQVMDERVRLIERSLKLQRGLQVPHK